MGYDMIRVIESRYSEITNVICESFPLLLPFFFLFCSIKLHVTVYFTWNLLLTFMMKEVAITVAARFKA
jgi:hypothetical protein